MSHSNESKRTKRAPPAARRREPLSRWSAAGLGGCAILLVGAAPSWSAAVGTATLAQLALLFLAWRERRRRAGPLPTRAATAAPLAHGYAVQHGRGTEAPPPAISHEPRLSSCP